MGRVTRYLCWWVTGIRWNSRGACASWAQTLQSYKRKSQRNHQGWAVSTLFASSHLLHFRGPTIPHLNYIMPNATMPNFLALVMMQQHIISQISMQTARTAFSNTVSCATRTLQALPLSLRQPEKVKVFILIQSNNFFDTSQGNHFLCAKNMMKLKLTLQASWASSC